jgi:RNA polymerase sigma factor (sigma-70 family)
MVARHGPALLRVANQFSLCQDDALDAYQRGLEIYLRRLETVDPATEGAWMRVVVKHEAMAIRRARQDFVAREEVDLDARFAPLRDVDEQVAGGERVDRSVEALRALKPDEAKALMLKAQGLSYQEIGRRFGWTYTKVNRSITEGRARFLKVFRGIEDGEACQDHTDALAALAGGTATSAQVVALRPHLRHCAACRAAVRELRFSRTRRIALLLPGVPVLRRLAGLFSRTDVSLQYAAASGGGGRLGPVAALVGLCLGGAGAAVCAGTGALPAAAPLIAHGTGTHHTPAPHRVAHRAAQPRRTPAPVRTVVAAAATPRQAATRTPKVAKPKLARPVATTHHAQAKPASHGEFGFENKAPAATPTPAAQPVTATAARAGGTSGGATPAAAAPAHRAPATAPSSEFGFEGG